MRELTPYVPGEQPRIADLVKLNTNESPFGPSPRALEAMRAAAADALRLYPDPEATALRAALAAYHGADAGAGVRRQRFGRSAGARLRRAAEADEPLLFPDVTYSFYPVYCRLFGVAYETVPLDEAMRVRVADYRRPAGAIIIPNPNAPTGIALPRAEIARLLARSSRHAGGDRRGLCRFRRRERGSADRDHPNLLVVQTMSKSRALAGLRVGYAIGDAGLIEALRRVKDSFNSYPLGRLAQAGAIASIEDEAYFQASRARVMRKARDADAGLVELGFSTCCRPPRISSSPATPARRRRIGRRAAGAGGAGAPFHRAARIAPYLRISVGTEGEIARLLSALKEILAKCRSRGTRLRRLSASRVPCHKAARANP